MQTSGAPQAADTHRLAANEVERLQRLISTDSPQALLVVGLGGEILAINRESERLFELGAEKLIGQSCASIITSVGQMTLREWLDSCAAGGRVRNVAAARRTAAGMTLPIAVTLSLLTDDAGQPVGMVVSAKDVAELRREAARQARLITAGELTVGLTHELNQPLAAINHYCDAALSLARSADGVNTELVDTLLDACGQAERAAAILRSIRDLVTTRPRERSWENLNALIEETTRFLVPEFKTNNVSLKLTLQPRIPLLLIDRVQIQQVIANLVRNGIEAMLAAGSATRQISIASTHDEEQVQVSVADTGPGIDPAMQAGLYDAFRTSRTDGLGLGLSICRSIVSAHAGRIWSDPPNEAGATFHFALPRDTE